MDCTISRTAVRGMMLGLAMLPLSTVAQAQRTKGSQPAAKRAAPSSVSDGRTTGFVLGVNTIGATGVSISSEDIGSFNTNFGPGAGLMIGYGFNRTFSAFASVDVAKQGASADDYVEGSFGLRHLEIGGRANLPFGDEVTVPYVTASLGRRTLAARAVDFEQEFDIRLSGGMFAVGGGVEHSFSSSLAMDGGVEIGFGRFDKVSINGIGGTAQMAGSNTIRLRAGVTWRPARRTS